MKVNNLGYVYDYRAQDLCKKCSIKYDLPFKYAYAFLGKCNICKKEKMIVSYPRGQGYMKVKECYVSGDEITDIKSKKVYISVRDIIYMQDMKEKHIAQGYGGNFMFDQVLDGHKSGEELDVCEIGLNGECSMFLMGTVQDLEKKIERVFSYLLKN